MAPLKTSLASRNRLSNFRRRRSPFIVGLAVTGSVITGHSHLITKLGITISRNANGGICGLNLEVLGFSGEWWSEMENESPHTALGWAHAELPGFRQRTIIIPAVVLYPITGDQCSGTIFPTPTVDENCL